MTTQRREALDQVLLLAQLLNADQRRFEEESGLTAPRIHLLWLLGESGPSTQKALAAALQVTPRNITGLVDGLAHTGHVTREPHPSDRRAALVTPTDLGTDVINELRRSHHELAEQLFADLPDRRLRDFVRTLRDTTAKVAQLIEEEAQS